MKLLTIVGARPQFVKAAVLSRQLRTSNHIEELIIHTGQHFDQNMSDVFFEEMDIPKPHINLDIHGGGHGEMTGDMIKGLERVCLSEKPDALLVYGDTNSTLAGAIVASKLHIPLAHVEAGLRSFNMKMPEEVNRIVTDRLSTWLFCPTSTAISNLEKEGFPFPNTQVFNSGDVMQDAALYYASFSEEKSTILKKIERKRDKMILCTVHRAENTNDPERLKGIFTALDELAKEYDVVCPMHPRTKGVLQKEGISTDITVIDPVGYFDMIELLKACDMVLTDSGGLQKEAFFFDNTCITMRDETEWVELVEGGFNQLVGASTEKILSAVAQAQNQNLDFSTNLYGGGKAGENIINILEEYAK